MCFKGEIKVLGVTFDSKLNWHAHINIIIQKCKKTLQAVHIISPYFTIDERLNIVTSLFYSKMYYASEIWLLPTLSHVLKRKLLSLSTYALRIVVNDVYKTFNATELHTLLNRFTPNQWRIYSSLLTLFRIFNHQIPEDIWLDMQINALPLTRANKTLIPPKNKIKVGVNSILNRLSFVSTLITNDQLNLSYDSFKIVAKNITRHSIIT